MNVLTIVVIALVVLLIILAICKYGGNIAIISEIRDFFCKHVIRGGGPVDDIEINKMRDVDSDTCKDIRETSTQLSTAYNRYADGIKAKTQIFTDYVSTSYAALWTNEYKQLIADLATVAYGGRIKKIRDVGSISDVTKSNLTRNVFCEISELYTDTLTNMLNDVFIKSLKGPLARLNMFGLTKSFTDQAGVKFQKIENDLGLSKSSPVQSPSKLTSTSTSTSSVSDRTTSFATFAADIDNNFLRATVIASTADENSKIIDEIVAKFDPDAVIARNDLDDIKQETAVSPHDAETKLTVSESGIRSVIDRADDYIAQLGKINTNYNKDNSAADNIAANNVLINRLTGIRTGLDTDLTNVTASLAKIRSDAVTKVTRMRNDINDEIANANMLAVNGPIKVIGGIITDIDAATMLLQGSYNNYNIAPVVAAFGALKADCAKLITTKIGATVDNIDDFVKDIADPNLTINIVEIIYNDALVETRRLRSIINAFVPTLSTEATSASSAFTRINADADDIIKTAGNVVSGIAKLNTDVTNLDVELANVHALVIAYDYAGIVLRINNSINTADNDLKAQIARHANASKKLADMNKHITDARTKIANAATEYNKIAFVLSTLDGNRQTLNATIVAAGTSTQPNVITSAINDVNALTTLVAQETAKITADLNATKGLLNGAANDAVMMRRVVNDAVIVANAGIQQDITDSNDLADYELSRFNTIRKKQLEIDNADAESSMYTPLYNAIASAVRHKQHVDKIKFVILYRLKYIHKYLYNGKLILDRDTATTIASSATQTLLEKQLSDFLTARGIKTVSGETSLHVFMKLLLATRPDSAYYKLITPSEVINVNRVFNELKSQLTNGMSGGN